MYRKKESVLMSYYSDMIKQNLKENKVLIVAIGNATFSSTGKGENGGVPTSKQDKLLYKVLKSFHIPFYILYVDEFNTTKCCYNCGNEMENVYDSTKGTICRGLKCCNNCEYDTYSFCEINETNNDEKFFCCLCNNILKNKSFEIIRDKCNSHNNYSNYNNNSNVVNHNCVNLKLCTNCSIKKTFRLRNRDLNAAINIWKVANCILRKLERPDYLKRPVKTQKILNNFLNNQNISI